MNKTTNRLLYGTIALAVLMLFGLLAMVGYYIYKDYNMRLEGFRVTNATDTGASYIWYTDDAMVGKVKVKEKGGKWLDEIFYDDRDMEQDTETGNYVLKEAGAQKRHTHHVSIRGLEAEKEYEVFVRGKLINMDKDKDNNDLPNITTTEINEDLKTPDPAYGLVDGLGEKAKDTVIIARLVSTDGTELEDRYTSVTTNDDSAYSFDLNYLTKGVDRENFIVRYEVEINLLLEGEKEYFTRRLPTLEPKPLPQITYEAGLVGKVEGELDNKLYSVVSAQETVCDDGRAVNDTFSGCSRKVGEGEWTGSAGSGHCNVCIDDNVNPDGSQGATGKRVHCGSCAATPANPTIDEDKIKETDLEFIKQNWCKLEKENCQADSNSPSCANINDEGDCIYDNFFNSDAYADVSENYATKSDGLSGVNFFKLKEGQSPSMCSQTQSVTGAYHTYCACEDSVGGHCVATDYLTGTYGQSCYNFCAGASVVSSNSAGDYGTSAVTSTYLPIAGPSGYVGQTPPNVQQNAPADLGGILSDVLASGDGICEGTVSTQLRVKCEGLRGVPERGTDIIPIETVNADCTISQSDKKVGADVVNDIRAVFSFEAASIEQYSVNGRCSVQSIPNTCTAYQGYNDGTLRIPSGGTIVMGEDVGCYIAAGDIAYSVSVNPSTGDCVISQETSLPTNAKECTGDFTVGTTSTNEFMSKSVLGLSNLVSAQESTDKLVTDESGAYVVYYGDNFEQPVSEFVVNLDGANQAEIRLFVDANSNGVQDEGEPLLEDYTQLQLKKESEVATYNLTAGWNLIAMPLISNDGISTAGELLEYFNDQGADIKHIAKYTDSGFEMYTKRETGQEFSNDFNIVPGQGYFILNYEPIEVSIKGRKFDQEIPFRVRNGWNLVGVYTNEALYTAEDLMKDMNDEGIQADVVSAYNSGLYTSIVYEDDILYGNNYNLFERAGYFVRVQSGGGSDVKFTPTPN